MSGVIASLAITVGTTAFSFAQASKQNKLQQEAQADAARAMADAKKRLEKNVYEKLGIAKLPYEQAREASLVQGAMVTEAARESERGVAAAAGRIQMAGAQEQQTVRAAQEQEILNLNKLVAEEEGRLLDIGTQLNLEEVAGAQQAARDAQEAKNAAIQQGIQGISNIAQTAIQAAPLYSKASKDTQKQALGGVQFTPEQFAAFEAAGGKPLGQGEFSSLDFDAIKGMSNPEYRKWRKSLTPKQQEMLFRNPQYAKGLDNFMNPFYYFR